MKPSLKEKHTRLIKKKARALGFDFCGISKAEKLVEEESKLADWLARGYHGKMTYLANHFDKRLDPAKLVSGAKSVVSLLYNYYPGDEEDDNTPYKIARYALGKDYHFVIKDKLKALMQILHEKVGEIHGRVFVDSAPVMERQWAARSGLGWIGKNTLLLNRQMGSFFFIAELIIDLELEYDSPMRDFCGTCTRCLDACPTDALVEAGILDASKCISYFTIELRDAIPEEFKGTYEKWIFGCDICQEVCPWNRFATRHSEPAFEKSDAIEKLQREGIKEITEEIFNKEFRGSPLKRTKYNGMKRNIDFLSGASSRQ